MNAEHREAIAQALSLSLRLGVPITVFYLRGTEHGMYITLRASEVPRYVYAVRGSVCGTYSVSADEHGVVSVSNH